MVSVEEATRIISRHLFPQRVVTLPLTAVVGRVLAERLHADRPFPPFNRVAMDGIAIRFDAWMSGKTMFVIEGTQAAGEPQKTLTNPDQCLEVMTGAILPNGTDTVIRYEDLTIQGSTASIAVSTINKGQNIHYLGMDAQQGDVLLEPGVVLSPAEIALLAATGKAVVSVIDLPRVAVIASGDELVEIDRQPEVHQVRRSNVYAIEAAMKEMLWECSRYHFADDKAILLQQLGRLKQEYDVLILSGGVSKGKFDFIPQVLGQIGVSEKFYQVSQRPGKPFWFGASEDGKIVFALPGNPVSTYMCFYKYIKPWLRKSMGVADEPITAVLASEVSFAPGLTYFIQVKVRSEEGVLRAYPVPGGGSGDFANLKDVSGFLELPQERGMFKAGEPYHYIPFR
jgi:molybdopterin molybdotransferase